VIIIKRKKARQDCGFDGAIDVLLADVQLGWLLPFIQALCRLLPRQFTTSVQTSPLALPCGSLLGCQVEKTTPYFLRVNILHNGMQDIFHKLFLIKINFFKKN
jgi:hypothetical protein